ncbi:MAG: glycoside hydrolase family 9 protein [Fibrobacterota bacterium]
MRKIHISAILLLFALSLCAKTYIRYNYLGYNPSRQKRFVVMSEENIDGFAWKLEKEGTKEPVITGKLGKSVYGKGKHLPFKYNYVMDLTDIEEKGDYRLSLEGNVAEPAEFPIKDDPYGGIISKPLRWMRVARCGSHNAIDHGFCHGGDTACTVHRRVDNDNGDWQPAKSGKVVDGFGGWHDAADYLKFSLTNAYACYFLLRAYEVNPGIFDTLNTHSTTKYNDLLDEAKWGLDFLMKTMPDTNEFMVMVADAKDHNVGYRLPEDDELDGERPFLSALSAPQMGYTAAALSLGSRIFKEKGDTELAADYLAMARKIYRRATSNDVEATAWLNDKANPFYADKTTNDNLELAAAELFASTGDSAYLKEAITYADKARASGWKAWESVNMPAHMRVMEHYPVAKNYLFLDLDQFLKNSRESGNIWGIPMKYVWAGLYSYIGVGGSAGEFEFRTNNRKYHSLARNMTDYLLGYNNWGMCFVAMEDMDHTITEPYSQVYNLQGRKFPEGGISEGPGDRSSWEKYKTYFGFDEQAERTYPFNTSHGVFYDNKKDFMCMETTICGVADGLYALAVASKLFHD